MYDQLFAAWKREIDDPTLGGLEPDFYSKITEYLAHIREDKGAMDKKSVKVALLEHEARNVERILGELLDLRYKKILKTIKRLHKAPIELLTVEEAKMAQNAVAFESNYEQFTKNLLGGELKPITVTIAEPAPVPISQLLQPQTAPKPEVKTPAHVTHKRLTLRFVKNIPAIMGADMKSYGPFVAEDVASLPELNARILVKQGLAVLVEVSS
jgi:DNA replication initiation complex subunit (GINS family)